jgi:hypothetical protein
MLRKSNNNWPKPVRDSCTDTSYRSRLAAGIAIAPEFGLDPTESHVWFKIIKVAEPGRFIDVESGKPIGANGKIISP